MSGKEARDGRRRTCHEHARSAVPFGAKRAYVPVEQRFCHLQCTSRLQCNSPEPLRRFEVFRPRHTRQGTMGGQITKVILETILICNRTNKKLPGRKSCSGLVTGNFENSKLFEGLVILKKKKKTGQVEQEKKKTCIASSDLFFLLFQVSLKGTVLNHYIEDNRCGRHVLDH